MTVLWNSQERLDPEKIVRILEQERRAWLEAANSIDALRSELSQPHEKTIELVHSYRARAEALKRLVARMCEQYGLPQALD